MRRQDSMEYNPATHHRGSIRLKGYDYAHTVRRGWFVLDVCESFIYAVPYHKEKWLKWTFFSIR